MVLVPMSKLACKICIADKGLTLASGPLFEGEYALMHHIEDEHHMPVVGLIPGESPDQAQARFLESHPDASTCEECRSRRAPWTLA
jgi:hypothetical protein